MEALKLDTYTYLILEQVFTILMLLRGYSVDSYIPCGSDNTFFNFRDQMLENKQVLLMGEMLCECGHAI